MLEINSADVSGRAAAGVSGECMIMQSRECGCVSAFSGCYI